MRTSGRRLFLIGAVLGAATLLHSAPAAQSPERIEVELQLADLLVADGRYRDAIDILDRVARADDPASRPYHGRALTTLVRAALRVAEFQRARVAAAQLEVVAPRSAAALATAGDALWASGRFVEAEQRFEQAVRLDANHARAHHGLARAKAATSDLEGAQLEADSAIRLAPRDGEVHHTLGTIYERLRRFDEAAAAFTNYINLLPPRDRSDRAAWSRTQVKFLRSFGAREPVAIAAIERGRLHTVPFRLQGDKVIVKARLNGGGDQDFVLDTGAEQTVLTRKTAQRAGVAPIVYTLAAGVGEAGVRGLLLGRLDRLQIGTLLVENVPCLIKNPERSATPFKEADGLSPLALGLSMTVDYGARQLIIGERLPETAYDTELPLRMDRLAMVQGLINEDQPVNFVVDTGGELVSISTEMARSLPRFPRPIALQVYGTSGRDRDAFLLPGVDLRFDAIHFPSFPLVVLNLRAPSALLGFEVGGIVGHRFLSRYRVDIDLARNVVRLKTL